MSCCSGQATAPELLADEATVETRRATCEACPTRVVTFGIATCGTPIVGGMFDPDACGCIIGFKIQFAGQKCPQGKW